jgi:hypothetical protein
LLSNFRDKFLQKMSCILSVYKDHGLTWLMQVKILQELSFRMIISHFNFKLHHIF